MGASLPLQKISELIATGEIIPDQELVELITEHSKRVKTNKRQSFFPDEGQFRRSLYPKHIAFMAAGAKYKERVMLAGNRVGKTVTGAFEVMTHATGDYPLWWTGRRFNTPTQMWVAGQTSETTRNILQASLLGSFAEPGTGMIPAESIIRTTPKAGVPDAISDVWVKHVSGGISLISFKAYDQGIESFMGTEKHAIWLDEEPPMPIYSECLVRTMTTRGIVLCTFTPLKGLSEVVMSFLPGGRIDTDNRKKFLVMIEWDEAPHLTKEEKDLLYDSIPPHQRSARTKGVPQIGMGEIYPVPEEIIACDPFEIPSHWARFFALDVGWKVTAGVWFALDRESDVLYIYSEYYRGECEPSIHADAIMARGSWIPGVVDPASAGANQKDGERLMDIYTRFGLNLNIADNSIEAGTLAVFQRLSSGRLKVFKTCINWFREKRLYRREESRSGIVKILKEDDHTMDATRYGIMSGIEVAITETSWNNSNNYIEYRQNFPKSGTGVGRNKITGY